MTLFSWCALFGLVAGNVIMGLLLWAAEDRAKLAREEARNSEKRRIAFDIENDRLTTALDNMTILHDRLLAKHNRKRAKEPAPEAITFTNSQYVGGANPTIETAHGNELTRGL